MIRILWTQKQDAGPGARGYAAMAYDSNRGRTVLFGGSGSLADTWEWDGENWTQMADSGPPGREAAAMAYDAQRNQTVLFGGGATTAGVSHIMGDTWSWDGRNWTQLADSGPLPRTSFAMAYDSKRQRIVLFGGQTDVLAADTWQWDGAAWTRAAVTGPSARASHAMAYDSTRDRTVLFGGNDETTDAVLGDTWEWNGSEWTKVSNFGATPCGLAALAFKGDNVALFGGRSGTSSHPGVTYGTTWTWDGRDWTLRQDIGPSPRYGPIMCYDSKRGTLVLYGGVSGTGVFLTDTWEHSEGP